MPFSDLPPTGPELPPSPPRDQPRFVPGQVLAGRYRVVAALGQGGMGEVYRADDLTLGQAVALKFLPRRLAADPDRLARLRNEVRVARQVAHPNVCRVYDIAEDGGQPFLTMEYIDGEDLAGLLRRIGRLPEDRAVELARQLCAGLQAAHDRGVLHRDLKPANVMIDGRGQVRITDFGLAVAAAEVHGPEAAAGTRSYRAPEQAAGRTVTARSDLFCLGLVLFEMFTGRRAFPDGVGPQTGDPPATPSSLVKGLDAAVERAILRCLQADPGRRPGSARAVAAALPGGDPLAAAVAAGETPSPELVANAGPEGSLRPAVAIGLLAAILLGLAFVVAANDRVRMVRVAGLDRSPEDLTRDAREVLERLGHKARPRGGVGRFANDEALVWDVSRNEHRPGRWDWLPSGRPAAVYFWYRQSPEPLAASLRAGSLFPGEVTPADPPLTVPGMATVLLDPKGRLLELHAVPAPAAPDDPPPPADWAAALLREARLDPGLLTEVEPAGVPEVYCDRRKAWEGAYPPDRQRPGRAPVPIRVEAAACDGRPVLFGVVEAPREGEPPRRRGAVGTGTVWYWGAQALIRAVVLVGGGLLAWRNWKLRRIDAVGTWRLALVTSALYLAHWAVNFDWALSPGPPTPLLAEVGGSLLFDLGTLWVACMALEPYVRARWPWRIVAWNRLLAGRFRDPLVGRSILVGGAAGLGVVCLSATLRLGLAWFTDAEYAPYAYNWGDQLTVRSAVAAVLGNAAFAVAYAFLLGGLVFLVFLVCRREWLAVAITAAAFTATQVGLLPDAGPFWVAYTALTFLCYLGVFLRFGVLALVAAFYFVFVILAVPLTVDPEAWYLPASLIAVGALIAVAVYGFVISLGGRPLFRDDLLAAR